MVEKGGGHNDFGVLLDWMGRAEEAADHFRGLERPFGLDRF